MLLGLHCGLNLASSVCVRYVSCVIGCPVEGAIDPSKVAYVAKELYNMGCSEISLGDTIGVGTPGTELLTALANAYPLLSVCLNSMLKPIQVATHRNIPAPCYVVCFR